MSDSDISVALSCAGKWQQNKDILFGVSGYSGPAFREMKEVLPYQVPSSRGHRAEA